MKNTVLCVWVSKISGYNNMGSFVSKPKKKTKNVPPYATVKKNKIPKTSPRKKITNRTVKLNTPQSERKRQVQQWFSQNTTPRKIQF